MNELPRFPRGQGRGERPKIARAVAPRLAHDLQPGEGMLGVEPKQHILLVVAQHDVVVRAVLLDAARFQQQGFLFRGGGQVFNAFGMEVLRAHGGRMAQAEDFTD